MNSRTPNCAIAPTDFGEIGPQFSQSPNPKEIGFLGISVALGQTLSYLNGFVGRVVIRASL